MRRTAGLCFLAALAAAEEPAPEPEPGPVPASVVHVGRLVIPGCRGGPDEALAAFLAAHANDKAGDAAAALRGYVAFLGMPGRHELPRRYLVTARERVAKQSTVARREYDAAAALYGKDRARGLAELQRVAERWAPLPEADAARALWHTDRLRAAIDAARAKDKGGAREAAVEDLEKAVRTFVAGLYMYEAKTLLKSLGGPDLLDPDEKIDAGRPKKDTSPEEPEEEPTIEIGGDG